MRPTILLAAAVLAFGVSSLHADTLRLRDGRVLTGTLQSATRNDISFRQDGGQTDRFDIGSVESVSFGNGVNGNGVNQGGRYENEPRTNTVQNRSNPQAQSDRYSTTSDRYSTTNDRYNNGRQNNGAVIPAGTVITVRMIDAVDSDATHSGDTYHASIDQPIVVNGQTMAPAGSDAMVQVVRVQQGGRITGREDVTLALASFQANGRTYDINTSNEDVSSNSRGKQSTEVIGGGAALGAIIGAIAGGGKGAAIGAASGAALGTGAQVLRGQRVKVPSETRLSFTLSRDVIL